MPDLASSGSIRDPLYGYIEYSEFERRIIDEPLFQRLRHISQNGLIQLTYPSNRTARFAHSLGTMHVGGEYLLRALRSSDPDTVDSFLWLASVLIRDVLVGELRATPAAVARSMVTSSDPFYRYHEIDFTDERLVRPPFGASHAHGESEPTQAFVKAVLLQSLRLACVVHDIGHFPFSHATEYALEALVAVPTDDEGRRKFQDTMRLLRSQSGGLHLHEAAGLKVLKHFFLLKDDDAGHEQTFRALCLTLAEAIAKGDAGTDGETRWRTHATVLRPLHELVSGDVDADRSDWVQRDAYASNFEFTFDFKRLSDSFRLVQTGASGTEGEAAGSPQRYSFRPSVTALSAVESFFLARYRIYLWMIQQKNVARTDLCLQRALHELFDLYFKNTQPGTLEARVCRLLGELKFDRLWSPFAEDEVDLDGYATTDEVWLTSLFREVLASLEERPKGADPVELGPNLARLRTYLRFLVWRNKDDVVALWRGPDDYLIVAEAFREKATQLRESYALFFNRPANQALLGLLSVADKPTFMNAVFRRQLHLADSVGSPGGPIAVVSQFERKLTAAMASDGFDGTFLFRPAQSFAQGPAEDFALVGPGSGSQIKMLRLTTLSRLVEGLPAAWSSEVQAFAFVVLANRNTYRFPDHGTRAELLQCIGRNAAAILLDPRWRPLAIMLPVELEYLRRGWASLANALSMQRLHVLGLLMGRTLTQRQIAQKLAQQGNDLKGADSSDLRNEALLYDFLDAMVAEGVFDVEKKRYSLSPLGTLVATRVADTYKTPLPRRL